ncbi:heterodisulfide reductase-related iron-sulfur binding cluster, partial [Kaarinaea lacus]
MAKKEYSFYPGCSSQKAASASNYQTSVDSMCDVLDIQLNVIPDWNCCSASIGYAGGGELPRLALSARNMALSEQANPGQDLVATCAACWLATRETKERLNHDSNLMAETNEALAAAGLNVKADQRFVGFRHEITVVVQAFLGFAGCQPAGGTGGNEILSRVG